MNHYVCACGIIRPYPRGISVLFQVGVHSWTFSSTQVLLCASVQWSREEKVPFTVIASESEKHSDTNDQVLSASAGVCNSSDFYHKRKYKDISQVRGHLVKNSALGTWCAEMPPRTSILWACLFNYGSNYCLAQSGDLSHFPEMAMHLMDSHFKHGQCAFFINITEVCGGISNTESIFNFFR